MLNMAALDWNDVRFALAAARTGSALTAAQALKVSQPTVGRRIAALEEALGVTLFERSQTGLRITDQGLLLLPRLEAVEAAAAALEVAARAEGRRVSGVLRVTTNEIIANYGLAPALREFRAQYPQVQVEVIVTDDRLDLAAGEADVAIRGGARPTEAGVFARRLGPSPLGVYGSEDYYARHGRPGSVEDLDGHIFIGGDSGPFAALERIILGIVPGARIDYRTSSPLNMIANARHGLGLAVLPAAYFRREPGLTACVELPGIEVEDWLVVHERMRHVPRVRAFLDFAAAFEAARRRA